MQLRCHLSDIPKSIWSVTISSYYLEIQITKQRKHLFTADIVMKT